MWNLLNTLLVVVSVFLPSVVFGITTFPTDTLPWTLTNMNGSISVPGSVPGGVYSDLMSGGVLALGDFYYRYNDLEYRWVSYEDWTYTTYITFPDDSLTSNERVVFEFDGLDTKADLYINDTLIYQSQNMFSKAIVDVKQYLTLPGTIKLSVTLRSPIDYSKAVYDNFYSANGYNVVPDCVDPAFKGECHANTIRKMQASFSWDWGPAFPNMGIWAPWRILGWSGLKISSLHFDSLPITPLPDKPDYTLLAAWVVNFKVFFDLASATQPVQGTLRLYIDGTDYFSIDLTLNPSDYEDGHGFYKSYFTVLEDTVETWWPNGYGAQPLYAFNATFTTTNLPSTEVSTASVNVGFRTVEWDESFVNTQDPTMGRYYRARVNNVFLYLMGSNWIPAHVLPELVTPEYTRQLLTAAKDAFQNSVRIWGGGIYELPAFYQVCDELGILIWHDMMFACSMYPADSDFLNTTLKEVFTQVEKLQHHPSILLWSTNNENEAALRNNWYGTDSNYDQYKADYVKLYVDVVANTLREMDQSRPVIISSPSNGLASEEAGYIADNPYDNKYGDTHHYNYASNGWAWQNYPATRFASEYGFQSFPSYYTLAPVFSEEDMVIDSPMLEHRQHHPNGQAELRNQLAMHFDYDSATTSFRDYLYLTQLHQAIAIKVESEYYRRMRDTLNADGSGLNMGALYWQLNDIWQGASWASVEFGGRWKILHYYAKKFFSPLTAIPYVDNGRLKVTIVNDKPQDVSIVDIGPLKIVVNLVQYDEGEQNEFVYNVSVDIPSQSAVQVLDIDLESDLGATAICTLDTPTGEPYDNCFITVALTDATDTKLAPNNFVLLGEPKNAYLPDVTFTVTAEQTSEDIISLSVTADRVAMFVFLESPFDGTFSDNGFIVPWGTPIDVQFYGSQPTPVDEFRSQLNVTYLSNSFDTIRFIN